MKSLLVVGGTGVISYAVVNEALHQGFHVTCINRGRSKNQKLDKSVEVIIADYRDKKLITTKLEGRLFDAVIDVLCYTEQDIDYSIMLFKDHCRQYMFFSSAEAYNKPKYADSLCTESAELGNPLWKYSINKSRCEERLKVLADKYNINYTIIRPAITYGNTRIPYGVMPQYGQHGTIIKRIQNKKPIVLYDGGSSKANFLRVEDFAVGIIGLIGNEKARNQDFHISGDECVEWKTIVDILGDILSIEPIYVNISSENMAKEMPSYAEQIIGGRAISQELDNSKIKSAVPHFKTTINLKEGITKTVDFYRKNAFLSGIDYAFDAEWDRIAIKYAKNESLNIRFVDYLGNATKVDRRTYWLVYHKNIFVVRLYLSLQSLSNKIVNRLKRLF